MSLMWRILCAAGGLILLGVLGLVLWQQGMEYTSWVGGVIGAVVLAGGLLVRALTPTGDSMPSAPEGEGDRIDQADANARGSVIGKKGRSSGRCGDRINQRRTRAEMGDIIGKQEE